MLFIETQYHDNFYLPSTDRKIRLTKNLIFAFNSQTKFFVHLVLLILDAFALDLPPAQVPNQEPDEGEQKATQASLGVGI